MTLDNDFKALQDQWQEQKSQLHGKRPAIEGVYKNIKENESANFLFYYRTILILTGTLIGIGLFFYFVAPVKDLLSRIGVGLMLSGLAFRIAIEIISISKAKRMKTIDNALESTNNTLKFHQYRKFIHSRVAPIVILLYTIGFYMITPEFLKHMPTNMVILMDVSYVIIGIILFFVIRTGVRKEMVQLHEILELKQQIMADDA